MEFDEALSLPEGPGRTAAFVLFRRCRDEIDLDRLKKRVASAGFESALRGLLAFDAAYSSTDPDATTLEAWANRGPQEVDG